MVGCCQSLKFKEASATGAERTPKDYAIEHAGYMATTADQLLNALSALGQVELAREEADGTDAEVDKARDTVGEYIRALHNDIYEFRKRRDRAATSTTAPTGKAGGVALNYLPLHEYAMQYRAPYNELCNAVRASVRAAVLSPPGESVDEPTPAMLKAMVLKLFEVPRGEDWEATMADIYKAAIAAQEPCIPKFGARDTRCSMGTPGCVVVHEAAQEPVDVEQILRDCVPPDHPEPRVMRWSELEKRAILEYGERVRAEVWEKYDFEKRLRKDWQERGELAEAAIREHNEGCVMACQARKAVGKTSCYMLGYDRDCSDCPRDWVIGTTKSGEVK